MALLCALMIVVPPIVRELFPFSSGTMFAFAPRQAASYEVFDPDGEKLSALDFGLHLQYLHDPPVRTFGRDGFGRRLPPSINSYDVLATEEAVRARVQQALRRFPDLEHVIVQRRVHGFDGPGPVQVLRSDRWTVVNEAAGW